MLAVPAAVWRWGPLGRALIAGTVIGVCLGGLAWLDSGTVLAAAAVFVVTGILSGVVMARRMAGDWPEAAALGRVDRVTVVRAVRRGRPVAEPRLREAAMTYASALRTAASRRSLGRYLLAVVVVVALATAVWDALYGSTGSAVASIIYLAALLVELLWWPRYTAALVRRTDRAVGIPSAP